MGFTYAKVLICNPTEEEKRQELELLVDTGALMSIVPAQILKELEIKPLGKQRFRAFGGGIIERDVGIALIKYEDRFRGDTIAFGEKDDAPLLGVITLEGLGYQVDPVTKKLKRVDLLML